jgi:exodeoxyribonuclease VII small subunit
MMEDLTFEQALQQLEDTVHRLEAGELPLDAALALFERGTELAGLCDRLLDDAELRVRQILPNGTGGLDAAPFDAWQREPSL